MKVLGLKDLARDESHIFYIRKFTGNAVLELPGKQTTEIGIKFSIEMNSVGKRTVTVNFTSSIDYPMIPLKKALTEQILKQEFEGTLPC